MVGYIFGTLSTSMPIEYSKKGDIVITRNERMRYECILHVPSPALHFTNGYSELLVLFEGIFLICDRLL
jgi:hypothetical protein